MDRPIGIFDSGKGGLTVLAEVKKQLPNESVIYYGDVARVPYGNKTPDEIIKINFEIITYLVEHGVKMVIIACNTSSALAIYEDRDRFPIPIIGIKQGAQTALKASKNKQIGVAATERTVASHIYRRELEREAERIKESQNLKIIEVACPEFVPLVEGGQLTGPVVNAALEKYFSVFKDNNIDTLIHGCTHYPFLEPAMAQYLGSKVKFIDPAVDTVREAKKTLESKGLLAGKQQPKYEYIISQMKGGQYVRVDGREYLLSSAPAYRK